MELEERRKKAEERALQFMKQATEMASAMKIEKKKGKRKKKDTKIPMPKSNHEEFQKKEKKFSQSLTFLIGLHNLQPNSLFY